MPKNLFLFLIFFAISFGSSSQARYCNKNRGINFYWDWHTEFQSRPTVGIAKETIYHQRIKEKDSVLEREIFYNKLGQPVIENHYAAPTREGLISKTKFSYNEKGLLVQKYTHSLNCVLGEIDVTVDYQYDHLNREIFSTKDGPGSNITETVYVNASKTLEREHFPNGTMDTTRVYFYGNNGREDSMQVFRWRKWLYTTEFVYDTVKNTKEAWFRYSNARLFRSRFMYNSDGTISSLLINNFPNWNQSRYHNVESRLVHNTDGAVRECSFFIKNKKVFVKKHYYEYY